MAKKSEFRFPDYGGRIDLGVYGYYLPMTDVDGHAWRPLSLLVVGGQFKASGAVVSTGLSSWPPRT